MRPQIGEPKLHHFWRFHGMVPLILNDLRQFGNHTVVAQTASLPTQQALKRSAALEACVDDLRPVDRHGRLDVARLSGQPRAIVRRALHRWLLE